MTKKRRRNEKNRKRNANNSFHSTRLNVQRMRKLNQQKVVIHYISCFSTFLLCVIGNASSAFKHDFYPLHCQYTEQERRTKK